MKISSTKFEVEYGDVKEEGSNTHGFSNFQCISVSNCIKIGERQFDAVYQTGGTYDFEDLNHPAMKLELCQEAGTDGLLYKISGIYIEDFEKDDVMQETLEVILTTYDTAETGIKTVSDLKEVHIFLLKNQPKTSAYYPEAEEVQVV